MSRLTRQSAKDLLRFECAMQRSGYRRVAGVDEVGRGALAGPLVAAAVVLPANTGQTTIAPSFWDLVRDSKTLSATRRIELSHHIQRVSMSTSVALVPCHVIDEIGLSAANRLVMEQAVLGLQVHPDLLLIDALTLDLGLPQLGIINGDALSLSIAAASIIAKVARDQHMVILGEQFPCYGFARHKGYGVPTHLEALAAVGPCEHHRSSFAPVRRALEHIHAAR